MYIIREDENMKIRMNIKDEGLKCEHCGRPITEEDMYYREINGIRHYFCCSHCADAYEKGMSS
jgi:hypothetical protein